MDFQPTDFLTGLGGLQNLPNPYRETQQVTQDQQQQQGNAQALQLGALKLAAIGQQQQQAQQYAADVKAALDHPTPQNFAALIAKYPDQHDALKQAWDAQDAPTKQANLTQLGNVFSFISNNRPDLAAKSLQARIDAERAQGMDTSDDEQVLALLNSGKPKDVQTAKGVTGHMLATVLGPEKYGQALKDLGITTGDTEGKVVGKSIGHYEGNKFIVDYTAPDEGQLREIKVTDPITGQETTQFVRVGGTGGGGPASSGGASPGGGGAPVSVRLNNPGAIKFDPNNQWQGQIGQQGGFVQFDTPANGARAHQKLIANQIHNGFDTPMAWAQHYAPASDGNDPTTYAQTIASGLGIGVNDKIPLSAVPKMAALSAGVEAGGTPSPALTGSGAQSGVVASFVTKPVVSSGLDPNLQGADALAALPKPMAARVQQLIDGRSILTAREKGAPQGRALMDAANQVDPTYDESTAPARFKAYKDFTGNGKAAQVASSGNRLAYHLNDLYRDSLALRGVNVGFSGPSNVLTSLAQSTQQAAGARYDAVLPFIAGELQKLTKNGTATEGETNKIMANLSRKQPNSVRLAAIQQVAELAEGQFKPFRDQYQSIFGANAKPPVDFTPLTTKIFDQIATNQNPVTIDHNGNAVEEANAGGHQGGGPVRVTSRAQAMALPSGTQFIDPSGTLRVRP